MCLIHFFLQCYAAQRNLHSFPTRRSSDLQQATTNQNVKKRPACSELRWAYCNHKATYFASYLTGGDCVPEDRKSGSAGMPRPISYAVFCLKKKKKKNTVCSMCTEWPRRSVERHRHD